MDTLKFVLDTFGITLKRETSMPIDLKDFLRADFAVFLKELGFERGAEIGVAKGLFTHILCSANPKCTVWGIDTWDLGSNAKSERFFEEAQNTLKGLSNCRLVRASSMEAVRTFEDSSLDFVYIDADHHLSAAVADIIAWSTKVRSGGIISGHDYTHLNSTHHIIHVVEAVQAVTKAYKVSPWFTFGRLSTGPLSPRDRTRSWMWVKP